MEPDVRLHTIEKVCLKAGQRWENLNEFERFDDNDVRLFAPGGNVRGLLTITILLLPALSFGYNPNDPNLNKDFSNQGSGNVDIGAHAPTLSAVSFSNDIMSAISGVFGNGKSQTSGVKYEKQASESLTRKKNRKAQEGENDPRFDDSDIIH